jgi:hypothetical protein
MSALNEFDAKLNKKWEELYARRDALKAQLGAVQQATSRDMLREALIAKELEDIDKKDTHYTMLSLAGFVQLREEDEVE